MTFLTPLRLSLLLLIPLFLALYVLVQMRRKRYALRFTNLPVLSSVAPKVPGWRRHLCAGLFLAMLAVMIFGWAHPATTVKVPRERATIMVAIDVSLSMMARDVEPDRFEAAKASAKAFIRELPGRFNVGVVAFAGEASVVASPSASRAEAVASIDQLVLGRRTAIGEAVFTSLQAVRSFDASVQEGLPPAHIVLLSDGDNTYGRTISEAIAEAKSAEIPVSTIAFGTPYGTVTIEGETTQVEVNKTTLRILAEGTNGKAYEAEDGDQLSEVYSNIGTSLGVRLEHRDVTSWFLGIAMLLSLLTAAASLAWFSRLP